MTRIIRLTESDLTRIVKRVIKEQTTMPPVTVTAQGTGLGPISSNELILGNNQKLTLYPTWNNAGTSTVSPWTFTGKYVVLPNNTVDKTNVIIRIVSDKIKGLGITGTYNCKAKTMVNTVTTPQNSTETANLMYRLDNGPDNLNNKQFPTLVQSHLLTRIKGDGLSTTDGPVAQLIAKYCK